MPIYVPKSISYTPESLKKFEPIEDNVEDFLQDPEQFTDTLPQPYRMLDKLVTSIFEHAWEIITTREAEQMVEASKIKPPLYSTDVQIEVHGPCKSICSSPNGDVLFIGKTEGLAVINANNQETIDEWNDPKMDIVNVEAVSAEDGNCLICTIDDLGIGRLFLYSEKTLYLMFAFNEPNDHDETSAPSVGDTFSKSQPSQFQLTKPSQKPIITKCQPSSNGDYIGVCFESLQTQDNWLDVFKITKETLLKELETANNRYARKAENPSTSDPTIQADEDKEKADDNQEAVKEGETAAETNRTEDDEDRPEEQEAEQGVEGTTKKSSNSNKSQPDKKSARFTAPVLVLKVKPQQPLNPCNFSSAFAAQSSADAVGDVLGTGQKHQISAHHMGLKQALFEHVHENHMKIEVKAMEKPSPKQPSFHFLNGGRLLPTGLDSTALQRQPTYLLLWWEDNHQVSFYPLTKQAKDIEFKPELVWPMADFIEYSTISKDNSLIAFGLRNNNLVIWDLLLGTPRKTLHLTDTGTFFKLQFLDPSIHDGIAKSSLVITEKPYKLATNCYLLAVFTDGQNFVVSCGLNDDTPPKQTSPVLKEWEIYTIIEPLPNLPDLAVTMRKNGQVFVEDILTGEILLAIDMPSPFKLFMPWQPVFALGGGGASLFIRGHHGPQHSHVQLGEEEGEDEGQDLNSLFVFRLRSFFTLDKYRKKARHNDNTYAVHTLINDRVNCLLKNRISQQATRQARMQQRWNQLKEELDYIKELRERGVKQIADRAFVS